MIGISLLFIVTLIHINEANKIRINSVKEKQKESFENQKINIIKRIKYDIDTTDHRMFYILYNIEMLLKQKNYEKAISLLELYRTQVNKYKLLIDTKNTIFDCLISLNINELISDGIDISTCIIISQNKFYDNFVLISILSDLIFSLKSATSINIKINEINNFSIIKLYHNCNNVNKSQIESIILKQSSNFNIKYTYDNNQINLSIKMEECNDI